MLFIAAAVGCAGNVPHPSNVYRELAPPTASCSAQRPRTAPVQLNSGCVTVVLELAQRYHEGRDVPKDDWLAASTALRAGLEAAGPWLAARVVDGDLYAALVLAVLQNREIPVPHSNDRLRHVLSMLAAAAEAGDAMAATAVGVAARLGWGSDASDRERALRFLRKAAEAGYAPAQVELGSYLGYGSGAADSPDNRMAWFRKAAEQGHAEAQRIVALEEDAAGHHELAAAWFRKAAEQGQAAAQFELGNRLRLGSHLARDPAQAAYWLRRAAEQGHAGALFVLGVMFERGEGVRRNLSAAQQCFGLAAIREHRVARFLATRPRRSAANGGVPLAWALKRGELNPESPVTQLLAKIERQYARRGPDSNVSALHLWFELQARVRSDLRSELSCTHTGFDHTEVTCAEAGGLAATATTDGSLLVQSDDGQVLLFAVPCELRPGAADSCSDDGER